MESDDDTGGDALLSRLQSIESQPLQARAAAYAQVSDELKEALEDGDAYPRHE